jgi:hypothetical protein
MRSLANFALVALYLVVYPLRAWGQVEFPKASDGYHITQPPDVSRAAPAGYEGRYDEATKTAEGNTPATVGKRYVVHFILSNQVKTCPLANGRSEGEGVFAVSFDFTNTRPNEGSTLHIGMRANARYTGKVGDNAVMDGPVNAEIDYTFNQSGSMRGPNGALATSAPSDVAQHITIPFTVVPGMAAPNIGPFAGGDPLHGHYAQAVGVGTALVYWAGIYYSIAETKWLQENTCVQVAFDPPSNSRQPVLGGEAKVNAQIKTKGGEIVKGNFDVVRARAGGVLPGNGPSDTGAPLKLTYTAPNERVNNTGFVAHAKSRAGVAEGEWKTGLGTGWSGQISVSKVDQGDEGNTELQDWSNYEATRITIDVNNGVGTANGFHESRHSGVNRRKALRGGAIVLLFDNSASNGGMVEGSSKATADVNFNKTSGKYFVGVGYDPFPAGTQHVNRCIREKCEDSDSPLYIEGLLQPMSGAIDDLNHVHGTQNSVTSHLGRSGNATQTFTMIWDLSRRGTTQ